MKKWTCKRVRLNAGGYEYGRGGKYYGHGEPLFKIESPDGYFTYMVRGATRNEAILNYCKDPYTPTVEPGIPTIPEDFYGFKR